MERTNSKAIESHMREHYVERPTVRAMEPPQCRGLRQRPFVVEGTTWRVCEDAQRRALFFCGPGIARRMRSYAANWESLSEIELYALSWSR